MTKAHANLDALVEYGLVEKEQLVTLKGNIVSSGSISALVDGADYIQESAAENYDVKAKVFSEMDRLAAPETILASSSSGLLMSVIQESAKRPERCIIAHPFNPPHLVPLWNRAG